MPPAAALTVSWPRYDNPWGAWERASTFAVAAKTCSFSMLVEDHIVEREAHATIKGEVSSKQPQAVDGYGDGCVVQVAEVNHDPPLPSKWEIGGCLAASGVKEEEIIHLASGGPKCVQKEKEKEKDSKPGTAIAKLVS